MEAGEIDISYAQGLTPFGNITHYKMLSMVEHLNVDDADSVSVEDESGSDTAAFEKGEIAIGCACGGAVVLRRKPAAS